LGRTGSAKIVGVLGAGVHRDRSDGGKRDISGMSESRLQAGARTVAMGIFLKKMAANLTTKILAC
jgi:hypothetical protein